MDVKFTGDALKKILNEEGVRNTLLVEANKVKARVQVPRRAQSKLTLITQAGRGPSGAFAQVIMRGPGALAIEFGSRNNAPIAPLRKALR